MIYSNVDQYTLLTYGQYYKLLAKIYSQIAGTKVSSPTDSPFNQDVWIAKKEGEFFTHVYHPGSPFNDALPNSVCSIFPEENALIVINQYDEGGGLKEGFSYIKMDENGVYQDPIPLNIFDFYENGNSVNLSMSRDSEHLFLSLRREDAIGDYDLFLCVRVNKDLWSIPFHIKTGVNSAFRETTPFISKDKKRLYFSSNRNNPDGNMDIYYSERLDYTYLNWSAPKKLPAPINTEFDESQPFLDLNEKYIYFTSTRDGSSDIFRAELQPSAELETPITINLRIINTENNFPTRGELRWGAAHKQKFDDFFRTYNGLHQITINKDEPLKIQAKKRGYVSEEILINPRELLADNITNHDVDIYIQKGQMLVVREDLPIFGRKRKVTLKRIYFEKGKDKVLPSSYPQLDELAKVLRENPGIYISIEGHTDNVGNKQDLLNLSYDRANSIKRFLMKKQVNPVRISTVGFGDERALNKNKTESDRSKNRRVEVRILRE